MVPRPKIDANKPDSPTAEIFPIGLTSDSTVSLMQAAMRQQFPIEVTVPRRKTVLENAGRVIQCEQAGVTVFAVRFLSRELRSSSIGTCRAQRQTYAGVCIMRKFDIAEGSWQPPFPGASPRVPRVCLHHALRAACLETIWSAITLRNFTMP